MRVIVLMFCALMAVHACAQETTETLNGLASADWQPVLAELDALVNSFTLSVPADGE